MGRTHLLASWERALDSAADAVGAALELKALSGPEATQLERRLHHEREWLAQTVREFPDLGSDTPPMRPLPRMATIKTMTKERRHSERRHTRVRRRRPPRRNARRAARAARRFSVNPDASGV